MKKVLATMLLTMIHFSLVYSQQLNSANKDGVVILETNPDKMPEYPGGLGIFYKGLTEKLTMPDVLIKYHRSTQVLLEFSVDKEGKVVNPKVVRGFDKNLNKQIISTIPSLERWKPGRKDGDPVAVKMVMPIMLEVK